MPTHNETATAEPAALEDSQLREFAAAIVDITAMHSQVLEFFREGIVVLFAETSVTEEGKPVFLINELYRELIISIRRVKTSDIVIR